MAQVILIGETVDIRMSQHQSWKWIPTHLTIEQFEQFVLPHLCTGSRGPQPKELCKNKLNNFLNA